ncbi:MAG: hypothetical protein ACOYBW_11450 [Fluviibacter phosphoraccumulans]
MNRIDFALFTLLKVAVWTLIWGLVIVAPVSGAFASYFDYSQLMELSFQQCLLTNAVRGALYLILFAGTAYTVAKSARTSQTARYKARVVGCGAVLIIWLFYWTLLSNVLYGLLASHFMFDCDANDMECVCDNFTFLYPLYIITAALGCIYYVHIYRNLAKDRK